MERATFDDAINWLAKYFNFNLSDERREHYWHEFTSEMDDLFASVIANDIPATFTRFPTPVEIRERLSFARERRYGAQKAKETADHRTVGEVLARTTHGADLAECYDRLNRGKGPEAKLRYLQDLREIMHVKYPRAGYLEIAANLEEEWLKAGKLGEIQADQENAIEFIAPDENPE